MVSQEADFAAYAIPQRGRAWEGGGGARRRGTDFHS